MWKFVTGQRTAPEPGETIEMSPLWLPHPTPRGGIHAKLADMDAKGAKNLRGKIAIFEADKPVVNKQSNHVKFIEQAVKEGALAVICSNGGFTSEDGESSLERTHRLTQNSFSPFNQQQWPIPAASIAYKDYGKLKAAVQKGAKAQMTVLGQMKPDTQAYNVIARVERGTKPIVVSTPLSGWYDSAGERGGGVALWLDLVRWAAKPERKASYLFNATSGHEIGHMGQDYFIEKYAPKPADTFAWLHLGSGLGTYDWEETQAGYLRRHDSEGVQQVGASPDLWQFVTEAFAYLPKKKFIPAAQAQGELRGAFDAGYATFGLYGGNMFSHAAFDGPEQVSPILLARLARGLKAALSKLETMR